MTYFLPLLEAVFLACIYLLVSTILNIKFTQILVMDSTPFLDQRLWIEIN